MKRCIRKGLLIDDCNIPFQGISTLVSLLVYIVVKRLLMRPSGDPITSRLDTKYQRNPIVTTAGNVLVLRSSRSTKAPVDGALLIECVRIALLSTLEK